MEDSVLSRDEQTGILYKKWACLYPNAVFLLVHGLGAFSGGWDFFSDFFLQHNISSYGIELKGFGETKELRGHIDSFDTYFHDIQRLRDIIKAENEGRKVFLVGESMGGLISFLLAGLRPGLFDGLICISPAFASRLKFSLLEYIEIYSSMVLNPKKQFHMPFNSEMCTRDIDYQKVIDTDERGHRLATAKLLLNIILGQVRADSLKDKIEIPVLFLIAGRFDKLIDPDKARKVFNSLETKDKEIIQYPEMHHTLPVDLGRQKLFEDILEWVDKRI